MNTRTHEHIDLSALKTITGGDSEKLLDYIEMYLEQTPDEIDKLKKYFTEKNWSSLEIVAHNMKSKAGYMGIQKLKELAEAIEKYDYKSDLKKLNDLICTVEQSFDVVQTELFKEKNRLKAISDK